MTNKNFSHGKPHDRIFYLRYFVHFTSLRDMQCNTTWPPHKVAGRREASMQPSL